MTFGPKARVFVSATGPKQHTTLPIRRDRAAFNGSVILDQEAAAAKAALSVARVLSHGSLIQDLREATGDLESMLRTRLTDAFGLQG